MSASEPAPPQVRALVLPPRGRQQRAYLREQVRERFWVLPATLMTLGAVLAAVTARASQTGLFDGFPTGLPVNSASTQNILSLIATSTLTFVGVVFTITLVALQLASSQLSPRVVRTFVRSGVTKLTFGMFLATFTFSIVVLALEGALDSGPDESRAVTAAIVLVVLSLVVFVVYVTLTMKLLQVSWVVSEVAREARRTVVDAFPQEEAYRPADPPVLVDAPLTVRLGSYDGERLRDASTGVMTSIDRGGLVALAARHDCVIELLHAVGTYLPSFSPAYAVHLGPAATPPPPAEVARHIHLGRARTLLQDATFGIRQLVDVASQALSPAVNQPTTAVHAIDRLEDLLLRIAHLPDRTGLWLDGSGVVRLVEPMDDWEYLVDVAFQEITTYGGSSVAVVRRLLAAYDQLIAASPPARHGVLRHRREELVALVPGAIARAQHRIAMHPDERGLG